MSGPVRPPLTVAESDGSPTVRPVNTIAFNSADFTLADQGGATVRVDVNPGAGTSLTDTFIGFGDSSNLLTGSANFTFTEESGGSGPTVLLTGDKPVLQMRDDTGATLFRTEFVQNGDSMFVFHRDSTGTDNELIRLADNYVFFNDDGLDIDIKMEGVNVDHLFSLDAAQDNIGIGGSPDSGVERLHVKGTGTDSLVRLESSDAGADNAPDLELFRNSPSPASADYTGAVIFSGYEDTGASSKVDYGRIDTRMFGLDGTESGVLTLYSRQNNALRPQVSMKQSGTIINENHEAVFDFVVESNESSSGFHNIYADSGQNNVGFGCVPDSGVERVHIKGTGTTDMVKLESSDAGASSAPDLVLYRSSASPADNDFIGRLDFRGKNSGGSDVDYVMQTCKIQDASNDGARFGIFVAGNASLNSDDSQLMIFGRTGLTDNVGLVSINNSNRDDVDLRVSSDNLSNLIRTKASTDNVGIGVEPNSNAVLHISNGGGKANTVRIESTDNDTSVGPVLDLRRNNADGTATDGDNLGVIQFTGLDDGGGSETYARIRATAADTHSTLAEGAIEFLAAYNNVETECMRIGPINDGGSANFGVDVNYNSQSTVDFRVRGDSVTNLLYVDVSSDKIGVNTFPRSGGSVLQVDGPAEFLSFYGTKGSATVALSNEEGYNSFITLTYDAAAQAITLPTAADGMKITLARQQATNAPTVVAAAGEKINGTAAPSTLTMGAQYSVMVLHGITGTGWIAYEPAIAA